MKLTENLYYSKNGEVMVQPTNQAAWQNETLLGVEGSAALMVGSCSPSKQRALTLPLPKLRANVGWL